MKNFFRKFNFKKNQKSAKQSLSKALVTPLRVLIFMVIIGLTLTISLNRFFLNAHSDLKVNTESLTHLQKLPKNQDTFLSLQKARKNPTQPNFTEEIKAAQAWRIATVLKDKINLYQIDFSKGIIEGSKDFNVEHNIVAPPCQTCVQEQIKQVNELINSGETDGIIIIVTDSIRLSPILEKAMKKGIPVIAVDTAINSDRILTFVVFDNFMATKTMGEWVSQQLGNKGNVLILNGFLDHQNAVDRLGGFLTGFQVGDIQILDAQSGDCKKEKAKLITSQWLKKFPDIDGIVAANDDMALGAIEAINEAKRKDILVTGFDATSEALESIKMGKMNATIDQIPKIQARLTLQLMIRHLEYGETFEPIITLSDVVLIDKNYLQQQQNK